MIQNTSIEEQRKRDYEKIKSFRLMDDDFMAACFRDSKDAVELILRIIMEKEDLSIDRLDVQSEYRNLYGHSVRLDIDATDSNGTHFDIEIQRDDLGAGEKRARYIGSLMDTSDLEAGQNYDALPEQYVIFITENDVLGYDEPIYIIENRILGINEPFKDGSHIIYVNGERKDDDTPLGNLMHDFFCTDAKDMIFEPLAERVRYFKEDEKGVDAMCKAMEEMRDEAEKRKALRIAERLLENGKLSLQEIVEISELTENEVRDLQHAN